MSEKNRQLLCTLGKMDIPIIQEQPFFKVDLFQSNILLIGSAGSGKSNFLKVLITEIHRQLENHEKPPEPLINENIYILDSTDSLKEYKDFPLVKAHYDFSNEEYIKRVFYNIENQYRQNVKNLTGNPFYKTDKNVPHTTLIIDNINSFLDIKRNEKYLDIIIKTARDGITKGISIVLTGSSTRNISSIMNYFPQKIALNLSTEEYLNVFSKKAVGNKNIPGRGYANVTHNTSQGVNSYPLNIPYELQIFHMDKMISDFNIKSTEKFTRFPLLLTDGNESSESNYKKFSVADKNIEPNANDVVIGVEYTKCTVVTTNFSNSRIWAIYGKRNEEKQLFLERLLEKFVENQYKIFVYDDGRKRLENLNKNLKINVEKYNYFLERISLDDQNDNGDTFEHKLSVLQQFIHYIHTRLFNLKDEKRYSNSQSFVLDAVMPNKYRSFFSDKTEPESKCVFVLQSREFFSNSIQANVFTGDILPLLKTIAEELDLYIFFTDAQRIASSDVQNNFNQCLDTAVLLDDIAEFVYDRGKRTVFSEMDIKDLKEQFGLCEENDAYIYQVDSAELKKIKSVRKEQKNGI
ncbi:MAG TPA: hypothetical protein DCG30_04985 [Ruminococcus sp.]|nr:hypothetical protein [Ruminococcus sp.]